MVKYVSICSNSPFLLTILLLSLKYSDVHVNFNVLKLKLEFNLIETSDVHLIY